MPLYCTNIRCMYYLYEDRQELLPLMKNENKTEVFLKNYYFIYFFPQKTDFVSGFNVNDFAVIFKLSLKII